MTSELYLGQVGLITAVLLMLLRRSHWMYRTQVVVWGSFVALLMIRYGIEGQLNFYSNDQRLYESVARQISLGDVELDVDYWLTYAKAPFTLPAGALAMLGIAPSLALKSISLLCLLGLTRIVMQRTDTTSVKSVALSVYLSACGAIGMLYSILALRETMMMLLTSVFFLSRSVAQRALAIVLLFLLRPHLAVCLVVAIGLGEFWASLRRNREENALSVSALIVGSVVGGYFLYSIGTYLQYGLGGTFGHRWGTDVVTRVASNFIGLQFFTARSETVDFSVGVLVALRLALSETVVIPTMFFVLLIVRPSLVSRQTRPILVAFALYVGLTTNTDFNSFRQNIPLMTVMGLVVAENVRRLQRSTKREIDSMRSDDGMHTLA